MYIPADGGPAFPMMYDSKTEATITMQRGMTLRDYFAAKAMQGMILGCYFTKDQYGNGLLATNAYEMADAMITLRQRYGRKGRDFMTQDKSRRTE